MKRRIQGYKACLSCALLCVCPFLFAHASYALNVSLTVDAASELGPLTKSFIGFSAWETLPPAEQQRFRDIGTRMIRAGADLHIISTAEGVYDWSALDAEVEAIKAASAEPLTLLCCMPDWLADKSYGANPYEDPQHPYMYNPPTDYAKWKTLIRDVVYHLNVIKGYGIKRFEVWNEPDISNPGYPAGLSGYELLYKNAAQGVKAADPAAKVGGPVSSWLNTAWIQGLINYSIANGVPLDAVDWHSYQESPAIYSSEASQARSWLSAAGLPASTELWITEWHRQHSGADRCATTEINRGAGVIAPSAYFMLQGGLTQTFYWTTTWPIPCTPSVMQNDGGAVWPQYNSFKMLNMLATTRVSASGLQLDSQGLGQGAIAAKDTNKVTVLIWNYQNTGTATSTVNLTVNNPPPDFSGKSIQSARYLMDATHSNYTFDPTQSELQKVENLTLPAAGSLTMTIDLQPNAVSLIVLTPSAAASDTTPPAAPSHLMVK